jgi:putative endonuclease
MKAAHHLGKTGEELAKGHLINKDYAIRGTNVRIGKLEIDIIAEQNGVLVIVEVRTRSTDWYMQPELSVGYQKMQHLLRAAQGYVKVCNWQGETRFDVIAVVRQEDGSFRIDHFEDAFQPGSV